MEGSKSSGNAQSAAQTPLPTVVAPPAQGAAPPPQGPPLPPSSVAPQPHQFPIVPNGGVPAFISPGQMQQPYMNNSSGIPLPGMMPPYPLVMGGPGGAGVGVPLNGQFVPTNQLAAPMIPGGNPFFNGMARAPLPGAAPAIFPGGMYPIAGGNIVPGVPPFGQHHPLGGAPPRMGNPLATGMNPAGVPTHHAQGNVSVQQRMTGPLGGSAPRPPSSSSHLQPVNVSSNPSGTPSTSTTAAAAAASTTQRPTTTSESSDASKAVGDAFKDAVLKRMAEKKGSAPTVTVTDSSKTTSTATATVPSSESTSAPLPPHQHSSHAHVPIAHAPHATSSSQHIGNHISTHHSSSVAPPPVPGHSPSHATLVSSGQTLPRSNVSQHATHAPSSSISSDHHSDAHRSQTSPAALQSSTSQPAGADLLAALRRADDDDEPAPSSPAPDRFLLARSGGKSGTMMTEIDRLELLERLRVEYAAKHHRAKLSYTLDALREFKENIRHELTSAAFPPGMKAHKLIPTGGRKVAVEDDPIAKAKKFFTSILNKLSRDNFNKLVVDLVKYDIKSQEMLTAIISTVFDKALEDVKYQDIYADLCKLLGERAQEWSQKYLRVMELDEKQAPAGAGWYFDVSGGSTVQDGEWQGPLTTKEEAQDKGYRISNFKRLLLNRCQLEFFREDVNQTGQEEEQDEAQKAARGASMTAAEIEEFRVRALRRKELRRANKKRMLSNMAFIGQLYMAGMLTSPILFSCCGKLLNAGKPVHTIIPDPDDIEALCKLLTLAGGKLEEEEKNKLKEKPDAEMKMGKTFELLQLIIDSHPKLESRSRFLVKDLIDLRSNKWELTGSASTIERQARTVTLAQAKALILAEEEAEKAKLMSSSGDSGTKGSYSNAGLGNSARQQVSRSGSGVSGNGGGRNDQGNSGGQDYRNQQRRTGPASTLGQRGKGPVPSSTSPGAAEGSSEDGWATVPVKGGKVLPSSQPASAASIQSPPSTPSSAPGENPLSPGAAPSSLGIKTVVLSGDALLKHVSTIVLEFCRIMDADELIRSVTEVSTSVNYQKILVQGALIDAVKSADARKNAGKAIVTLANKGLMHQDSIINGLATFMNSYSDLVADAPKIFEYTANVLSPIILAGSVSLTDVWQAFFPAAAVSANSSVALVVINIIAAIAADSSSSSIIASVSSNSLPLVQLVAPGHSRYRKIKQALSANAIFNGGLQQALFSSLLEGEDHIQSSLDGTATSDALLTWSRSQPDTVQRSPSFARGIVADAVFKALTSEKIDQLKTIMSTLSSIVAGASSEGSGARNFVESFVLSGVHVACVADELFPEDAIAKVVSLLKDGGVLSVAGIKTWMALVPSSDPLAASVSSTSSLQEVLGRSVAEKVLATIV